MGQVKFIIPLAPMTKKNSQRIVQTKTGKPLPLPSAQWQKFCTAGMHYIRQQMAKHKVKQVDYPVNCKAHFYRERDCGDASNYYNGLADVLEVAGLVVNDKWIVSWDGSKMRKDSQNPRVEFVFTEAEDDGGEL